MWWVVGLVAVGFVLWFLANLRGRSKNRLLEVSVATPDGEHYQVAYEQLREDMKPVEYVRIILMFAAKMLYNMGDTQSHAQQKRAFLEALGQLGSMDPAPNSDLDLPSTLGRKVWVEEVAEEPGGRSIRATLGFVDATSRSIFTKLPASWYEDQFLDSWLAVLQTTLPKLDGLLTRRLFASLERLHELYRSGEEDPTTRRGLISAPNRAFVEAQRA